MRTPPAISWSDLAGAEVGVWGLGVEGSANVRRLRALGVVPVLVDDRPPPGPVEGLEVLATASGGLEALRRCDAVLKTPGISRYRPEVTELWHQGVPVLGGLGLWLQGVDRSRVLVVTGTKGKSTTVAVAAHLARRLGRRTEVAGNIGRVPYDPADPVDEPDLWVVEVSSFQATDLTSSPPVVAVTSLHPDHLDWHGDADTYFADKLSAASGPGARVTVADATSPALRARQDLLGPEVRWVGDDDAGGEPWLDQLGLAGAHNRRNARIAREALVALGVEGADDDEALSSAARGFTPLPHRLEHLGTVAGVAFVDDSLSTNVLPTQAALEAMGDRRVALVVGGFDRGIDYQPLAETLAARRAPTAVFTLPANGPRIAEAVRQAGPLPVEDCADLPGAVAAAYAWARPDGVVLLSPAAPSFGQFADYRERSAAFAEAMAACRAGS